MKHAKAKSPASVTPAIVCLPRMLPRAKWVSAARQATMINPLNHPPATRLGLVERGVVITPEHIAVLTTKYWHTDGVHSRWASSTTRRPICGSGSCCT